MNSTDVEAKKLATKLKEIQQALRVAGDIRRVTDPKRKSWLEKLEEISYDIDDVLDEWDWVKNIRLQTEEEDAYEQSKVIYFLQSLCLCYRRVFGCRNINTSIKQLNHRLDLIGQEYGNVSKLIENWRTGDGNLKRVMTTSYLDVSEIHGRDDEKEILVSELLSEGSSGMGSGGSVPIISIVGPGGMGKTTLAQAVFNDERVENHFDRRAWAYVSHPFDEIRIARAILGALTKKLPNVLEIEALLQCIVGQVSGRDFLLVLDDVWTEDVWAEDEALWKPLRICLNNGGSKSRILVTTRNTRVAQMIGSTPMQVHPLCPLSDTYCWKLFCQIAFHTEQDEQDCSESLFEDCSETLEETSLKIVKKCKGLPLAVKAIAGLLHPKIGLEEWRKVSNSQVWEWEAARTKIFPVLGLSYDELHPVAKRCFSFCAILPKDEWINVDMLVRIWCAQGFLSSVGISNDMESKGREIFDDLAMRCFFQDFRKNIQNLIVYCKMHDILHDFARFLAKNECLIVENAKGGVELRYDQIARHVNLHMDKGHVSPIPTLHETLDGKCRSFFITGGYKNCTIPTNLLRRLKRVRVLSIPYCELEVSEIGSLIHLRSLDLTGSPIKELPETTCELKNLRTLILVRCGYLSGLPQGIRKLRNLRHLLNDGTSLELPEGFDELTNLRTFSKISADSMRNWKNLGMLSNLNQIRGCLSVHVVGSENADNLVEAAKKADLKNKYLIEELYLFFGGKVQSQVIEALQPHQNLQILTFSGPHVPKWVATLTYLREVTISITKDELAGEVGSFSSLPRLGKLPFLEVLWLCRMVGMECLSRNFLGIDTPQPESMSFAFRSLKRLTFTDCKEWEEWEDISEEEENSTTISILPSLVCLELYSCPKLQTLPHRLLRKASSLEHLMMDGCDNLHTSFKDWGQSLTDPGICRPPNGWNYRNIVMDEGYEQAASEYFTPDVIQRGKLREQLQ